MPKKPIVVVSLLFVFLCFNPVFAHSDSASAIATYDISLRGLTEFGFVSGYRRYGRNDSQLDFVPAEVFANFCFSDHQFVQPFVAYLAGDIRSYFHGGLKYGIFEPQTNPQTRVHYLWHFGAAYQHVWEERKNNYGFNEVVSRPGFYAPIDFGIKWQLPNSKTALTFLATVSVGNDDNNTQWGWGACVGISVLSKSLQKE